MALDHLLPPALPTFVAADQPIKLDLRPDTIDIVTVVHERDLRLFLLQLRSIDLFFEHQNISTIHVILNGKDNDALASEIRLSGLSAMDPDLASRVQLTRADNPPGAPKGWYRQQALKLLAARQVGTSHYLVLDAKNHFIRRAGVADFFAADGRAFTQRSQQAQGVRSWLETSLAYFGVDNEENARVSMPTITPYVLNTDAVRGLIRAVEEREQMPFDEAFYGRLKDASEFFLYYAYLLTMPNGWKDLYADRWPICATIFRSQSSRPDEITRIVGTLTADTDILMFGLHRDCLPELGEEQRAAIARAWIDAGLVPDRTGADYFMAPELAEA